MLGSGIILENIKILFFKIYTNFFCKLAIPKNPSTPNLVVKLSHLLQEKITFVLGGPLFSSHPVVA